MKNQIKSLVVAGTILALTSLSLHAQKLTVADVKTILGQTAAAAKLYSPGAVIAITDRQGFLLAAYSNAGAPSEASASFQNAVSKAGTAAFLSSGADGFTTRTAGFIIQDHFPPTIENTPPGPLVGVGFSSLPFSDVNHYRKAVPSGNGTTDSFFAGTSLNGRPGGVPLYINNVLVGGLGVDSGGPQTYNGGQDTDEIIAVDGQAGYAPAPGIIATNILLNGIRLPYVLAIPTAVGTLALKKANYEDSTYQPAASPNINFPAPTATQTNASPFPDVAGTQRPPFRTKGAGVKNAFQDSTSTLLSHNVNTAGHGLTHLEVYDIIHAAAQRAISTRGAIRNPAGASAEVFVVVVDYYNGAGGVPVAAPATPRVLGAFGTQDATIFSYDVAAQKARTALFFSSNTMAMSTRCVGFLAQDLYPPGINGTSPGPYFGLQNALSVGTTPVNGFLPNGITIFPGGFPLYRDGKLIGAIGVSGDGVDQDDLISASGSAADNTIFEAPTNIRSDQFTYGGARLPYAKFPENAGL